MSSSCRTSEEDCFPFSESDIEKSFTKRFEAFRDAAEALHNLGHAINEGGPLEHRMLFQGKSELYRSSLSSVLRTLLSGLRWKIDECDGSVEGSQDTAKSSGSAEQTLGDQSLVAVDARCSSDSGASCPIVVGEQVAFIYQREEQMRLQVQDLNERIACFEQMLAAVDDLNRGKLSE